MQSNAISQKNKINSFPCNFSSILQNPRIQLSLEQLNQRSSTVHLSSRITRRGEKDRIKNRTKEDKMTFRAFIRERRTFKPCEARQKYIDLKSEIVKLVEFVENNSQSIEMSRFLQLKEKIMLSFMNDFVNDLTRQNIDKAELLVTVWNNLFLLAEKSFQKVCEYSKKSQKLNLIQQRDTHEKYQRFLNQCISEKEAMRKENEKKENFMKILVAKLRQYKRSIKKMEQTLRIAAQKLNQFRRGYLEIQIECINLTMELKNIGEESAKEMVGRKMALISQKSKEYKILPSKKKMKKELRENVIDANCSDNERIKEQFYDAYNNNMEQKIETASKVVGRAIEAIIDKDQQEEVDYAIFNQNLIEKYQGEEMVDKETDMQGFEIDTSDKKVGINPSERFFYQMTKIKGVQTMPIEKPPPIRTDNYGLQCDFQSLKVNKFAVRRTLDLSFLFENTLKSSNMKRQQFILKSNLAQNDKYRKKFEKQKEQESIEFNEAISQNEAVSSVKDVLYQFAMEQFDLENKSDPKSIDGAKNLEIKRRIRKLASTLSNKVSFLNTFLNQYRKKEAQSQLEIVNQNEMKEIEEEKFSAKGGLNWNNEPQWKNNQRQRSNKKIKVEEAINNGQKRNLKQFNSRTEQTQKSLRTQRTAEDKSKQNLKGKSKKLSRQESLIRREPILSEKPKRQAQRFTSTLKKQLEINRKQFYRDISQQLQKTKGTPIELSSKSTKLKDMHKIIDSVFQMACKQFQSSARTRRYYYYLYEAINNSYGIGNTTYVHRKVIIFIREVFQEQESSPMLKLFVMMIGLGSKGEENQEYSHLNNQLIIKLASKLCNNWRYPLKLSELTIGHETVQESIQSIFQESGFCSEFIFNLLKYMREKGVLSNSKLPELLPILLTILTFMVEKQNIISISYDPLLSLIASSEDEVPVDFVLFLIQLHFYTSIENRVMRGKLRSFSIGNANFEVLDRAGFAYFCCQNEIHDFSRLFYRGLSIFRLKENDPCFQEIPLQFITCQNIPSIPPGILSRILHNRDHKTKENAFFHTMILKNLLILLYLKVQDHRSEDLMGQIIGEDMRNLFAGSCVPIGDCQTERKEEESSIF